MHNERVCDKCSRLSLLQLSPAYGNGYGKIVLSEKRNSRKVLYCIQTKDLAIANAKKKWISTEYVTERQLS